MRTYLLLGAALLALLCASSLTARADVVGPPPDSCPTGSTPDSCHGGAFCAVSGCLGDEQCKKGMTCQKLRLCVGEISCVGMWDPSEPLPAPNDKVTGVCIDDGSVCAEGTCKIIAVCAPPPLPPDEDAGGSPGADAGTAPPVDAGGVPSADTGEPTPQPEAGAGTSSSGGGSGCSVGVWPGSVAAVLLLLVLALLVFRRRADRS